MPTDSHDIYRQRIYTNYVNASNCPLAPADLDGLAPRMPYFQKMIRRYFPADRDAAILELGCGHGALLYALQQAGYRNAHGVDCSLEQVEAANRLGIHGIIQGDLMDALQDEPEASQDTVISFDVIEHFTKDELIKFIDEVFRVLKPCGHWIVHAPNAESPFFGRILYGDFTHESAFTSESITQLFKSSGFTKVICEEDIPIPHGIKSGMRWALWKLLRSGLRFYLAVETGSGKGVFTQNFLIVAIR